MSSARIWSALLAVMSFVAWTPRALAQLAPPPPMQAGGLAPPPRESAPPPPPPPQLGPTQLALEAAQDQDSGRGLEFVYFDLEGGFQFVSLDAFSQSGALLPYTTNRSGFGPLVGIASGFRLLFFTIGPRFEYAHFSDWNLWTLDFDAGWHVPLGRLEPHGRIGAGYARLPLPNDGRLGSDLTVSGFNVRLGGGVDYYVTNVFSIGVGADFQLLRLSRSASSFQVMMPGSPGAVTVSFPDASSFGLSFSAALVAGFHF